MWFNKILNPERLKKIKGNRETFGFNADMLIIYNFLFTTSLSVYSELLTAFPEDECSLKLIPAPRVSIWIGDVKLCDLLSGTHNQKFYFNAPKCELMKVQIF